MLNNLLNRLRRYTYIACGMRPWSYGYYQYKFFNIANEINSENFNPDKLRNNYGYRIDERIIEYPWFFSKLPISRKGKLLDLGSTLNYEELLKHKSLTNKDVYISTLAPEYNCFWKDRISYVFDDMRNSCFRDDYFDWIVCLSTLEHVGMDNTLLYTEDITKNETDTSAYISAIKDMHRILKNGGMLFLSVPYGKHANHGWFQVFDSEMVDSIISAFNPSNYSENCYQYLEHGWINSDRKKSENATYFDIHKNNQYDTDYAAASRAVICLKLQK